MDCAGARVPWVATQFLSSCRHVFGMCRDSGRSIDHQIAVLSEPHLQPGQRLRSRSRDRTPIFLEGASVAGTRDLTRGRLIDGETAKVSANRAEGVESLRGPDHEDSILHIQGYAARAVMFGLSGAHHRRRFIKDVGREVSESKPARPNSGDREKPAASLDESATVHVDGVSFWLRDTVSRQEAS